MKEPTVTKIKKVQQVWSSAKSMLVAFSTWRHMFTVNFFLLTACSTLDFYSDVLRLLRENVPWERLEIWHIHNWLHHDNAPTHTSLKITEFVTNSNMVTIPHPPYPLNLAPYFLTLFPKLKIKLKVQHFETVWHPKGLTSGTRKHQGNDFYGASEARRKQWDLCIRPWETVLKEMTTKRKLSQHPPPFFFLPSPGTFR